MWAGLCCVSKVEWVVEVSCVACVQAIVQHFETAIDHNKEGIVMKLSNAPYGLNERADAWVKLKPDYVEGVSETLDVVIVGGYLGEGTVRSVMMKVLLGDLFSCCGID